MLCERCQEREAKVHITKVVAYDVSTQVNLCEVCSDEIDAGDGVQSAGWTSYDPPRISDQDGDTESPA